MRVTKAKDLQSTSTLEQFMAKLCHHHQRQIVDAVGFLHTEVKALGSSGTQQAYTSTSGIQGSACSPTVSSVKSGIELRILNESTPKPKVKDVTNSNTSICAMKKVPENAVSLKTSLTSSHVLDVCSPGSASNISLLPPSTKPADVGNIRHGDHAPLKMKIMTSNVADGKKLSCVLNTSLSSSSDTLDERQGNSNSSNRTEALSARLSSSVKRHNQTSNTHQVRQKETKESPVKQFSVHMTISTDAPRTARKTMRSFPDNRTSDAPCRTVVDPDLGHCDIVYIDKPITECFKEQRRSLLPRRNARKSTRGHVYSDEFWELKTVRTLAGRGNCPNPMPERVTLVTPKQILSKPEGVPPVDMPYVGACSETINQQVSTEELDESGITGAGDTVEVRDGKGNVVVETSQTDQCQSNLQSASSSPTGAYKEYKHTEINTIVERIQDAVERIQDAAERIQDAEENVHKAAENIQDAKENKYNEERLKDAADLAQESTDQIQDSYLPIKDTEANLKSGETVSQSPPEAETNNELEESMTESTEQMAEETTLVPDSTADGNKVEIEVTSVEISNSEIVPQEYKVPSPISQVLEEGGESKSEEKQKEVHEPNQKTQFCKTASKEESSIIGSVEETKVEEMEVTESEMTGSNTPAETQGNDNDEDYDYDLSSKTLDSLLKELPPWRRKRGSVAPAPKKFKQTEKVVGYFNGRPIFASDRSLRRLSLPSSPSPRKTPVKSRQNVNNTSVDTSLNPPSENKDVEKCPSEKSNQVGAGESSVISPVTESPSKNAPSPKSKSPSRTTLIHKQMRESEVQDSLPNISSQVLDTSPGADSKRQLRSGSQKPSSPESLSDFSLTSSLQKQPLPPAPPISFSSNSAAVQQEPQPKTAPVSCSEVNLETYQPMGKTLDVIEVKSESPAKQKLRSAKAMVDTDNEKQQTKGKRVLRKEPETSYAAPLQKPSESSLNDRSADVEECNSSELTKPTRMPLRSEGSPSPQVESKKVALRSKTLFSNVPTESGQQSDVASPLRSTPDRMAKAQMKPHSVSQPSVPQQSSASSAIKTKHELPKQTTNKFFEALTGEENQNLITNLNMKYEKMQKGWVQMDKETQAATKYKNKSDRQAAIWKSKRRAKKQKFAENQKYSPVQVLFMKGFNLTNICRWFLESTETKSLVIVKKVNTRLPSETQLCFHSSSSSGTSQGVYPSLQAERLKKHLKKFAIASPVKCNPKNQKLIAKALEQEANSRSKERRDPLRNAKASTRSNSSDKVKMQSGESQKSCGKSKNPTSARILRKYSNIRGKMKVQQTKVSLKKAAKVINANKRKNVATAKTETKSNLKISPRSQKSSPEIIPSKEMKEPVDKLERKKTLAIKTTSKHLERTNKAYGGSKSARYLTREMPKRTSQRLGSPKTTELKLLSTSKSKMDSKKTSEAGVLEVVKPTATKAVKTKGALHCTDVRDVEKSVESSQDARGLASADQVLTRSQKKVETALPLTGSARPASKWVKKTLKTQSLSQLKSRKAEKPTLRNKWALKRAAKRSQAVLLPRSATKAGAKRPQDLSETPAKRTRMSLLK